MPELYSRLINLIGKKQDHSDFEKLYFDLGEPKVSIIGSTIEFPKVGIDFDYDDAVMAVFFHFNTVSVRCGGYNQYTADLPSGISVEDQRITVRQKLSVEPVRSERMQTNDRDEPEDYWEYYHFKDLTAIFSFDGVDERLRSLSVHPHLDISC